MMQRLKPLVASLCLFGFISAPVFAASNQNIDQLAQQVSQLQSQVQALQNQNATKKRASHHQTKKSTAATTTANNGADADQDDRTTPPISGVSNLPNSGATYLPVDIDVPGQSFVSSGPYIGIPLEYSGGDLIINAPSVNQDVALLKIRKNIRHRLLELGVPPETTHAHVLLSGIVEGQANYTNVGGGADSTDINLTSAGLDAYILGPSDWLSALISLNYDSNAGAPEGSLANNSRDLNSRVFVSQAFITVGNFTVSPVYGTVGQMYVPFGTYSSNLVTAPLTQSLARTKARAILLGYQQQDQNALYAAGYIFHGDSHAGSVSRVNNGGLNIGYRLTQGIVKADAGAGIIANIADSIGMQVVSNTPGIFNGFGGTNGSGNEHISHQVPAVDLRGMIGIGTHIDLLGEYIFATSSFSRQDLTMNSNGAKPQALDAEAAYTFTSFARPCSVAIAYGMTKDALALQLPAQRYSLVFNTSIWRDTLQSLEFRHDINYAKSNTASGSGVPAPASSGKPDTAITAQFDVYF